MPRAKRAQVVSLTKVKSKGRDGRKQTMEAIREAIDTYDHVWVFSVHNMRNQYLKQVRNEFRTSRFFFGANRVMAKALGNTAEDEVAENIHKVSEKLVGDVGLLFTNQSVEETQKWFDQFTKDDYARAGTVATYRVVITAGEVLRGYTKEPFPNNMEPQLRQLGMPTMLRQGKITIDYDYVICEEGDKLTPQQAHLLKHFWEKMAVFKIKLLACYHKSSGELVGYAEESNDETNGESNDELGDEDGDESME
ncbi:mRNA turnover and ribosome assembly protein [Coemansia spiralis]|uniref:Ribosome assembly factor mrt4 n=2 Tax=Coemansia TaxID=4863 RepID=A0A9W8GCF3_9FUNG|nr:mRNA turnover 4 [Coemansia spiralis]KAJ1996277.1 mRNA turnover and ribosome assembly protein [Coemansia umbellata]KAJ2625965.1 mRNA turnover and ribosome assembly protein [Coemansia sp. RSA 1358]KAJ2680705.1 mRNA turnover and ribosome assembly protein [Coemansia spiralis]